MARAHNVYVVMRQSLPIAGFTVKHEMVAWLERRAKKRPLRTPVRIYRLGDNDDEKEPVMLLEKELLAT